MDKFWLITTITISISVAILLNAFGNEIDMNIIEHIESSGKPWAYNKTSGACGTFQVTPIVLKEFNQFQKTKYTKNDLFTPTVNYRIAYWYLYKRIPQMLRYYNEPVTLNNILISYNAGISYVVKHKPLPKETINYLRKYSQLTK